MREERSKNPLALMEQVIMILVFALAAAICVRAFVVARNKSVYAERRDHASLLCQSVANEMKGNYGEISMLSDSWKFVEDADGYVMYFDENWKASGKEQGYFMLRIRNISRNEYLGKALVLLETKNKDEVFSLTVAWQEGVEHE